MWQCKNWHVFFIILIVGMWLPQWLSGTESAYSARVTGDTGSIPALGRSPRGGNDNPLQYSCLENTPTDTGAWGATVHGVSKSWTWLSDWSAPPTPLGGVQSGQTLFSTLRCPGSPSLDPLVGKRPILKAAETGLECIHRHRSTWRLELTSAKVTCSVLEALHIWITYGLEEAFRKKRKSPIQ